MSQAPSFFAALKETVRAVFADDPPDPAELFRLVREHQVSNVLELLKGHPQSWRLLDDGGHSLLHWAALGGNLDVASGALAAGVSVDIRGGAGAGEQTPLMWAVSGGIIPMVQLLLDAAADMLARDSRGATCLLRAVQQTKLEPMPLLAERGGQALLQAGDKNGCTSAHWAAYTGSIEALTMLESLGADLHTGDSFGMTPLQHAVWAYRPLVLSYLIALGADPMICNSDGKNCIDIAEEKRNLGMRGLILSEMLKCLLTQRPRRGISPKGNGKDAAEALLLRSMAADTPVAHGVAVSWLTAWAGLGAARAPGEPPLAEEVLAAGGEAPLPRQSCVSDADIVRTCTSFDMDYVSSVDKLRVVLAKRTEDQRAVLREELLACFVVTDRHGVVVDLLSNSQEELPPDRFPLHARLVALRETSANELAKLSPLISTGVLSRIRAAPDMYHQRALTRVPASLRWPIWKELLCLREKELPRGGAYSEMGARENEWTTLISNDISRTFMSFDRQQQQSLQRMLNAYAVHNPEVGYCQGMNMIAGLLLLISNNEEESFGVLTCLMDDLGLSEFYREGFPRLRSYLEGVDELMAQHAPDLVSHFATEGVELNMYLQQWFLTLFIDCLPLPLVVTIWDAIICEGLLVAIKVAVSILTSLQEPLLAMRFQDIATAFKTMRRHADGEGEWKAFEAGHLLIRQAAMVEVPERLLEEHGIRRKSSSGIPGSPGAASPGASSPFA